MRQTPILNSNALSPQACIVLAHLQSGKGLSNLLALTTLGIGSLSTRISELRALGYDITSTSSRGTNGKRFAVYRLVGAKPHEW